MKENKIGLERKNGKLYKTIENENGKFYLITDKKELALRKKAQDLAYRHHGVGYWAIGRLFWVAKEIDIGSGMSCSLEEAKKSAKNHYFGLTGKIIEVK